MSASVLLISNDPSQQFQLAEVLRQPGYALVVIDDPERALATAPQHDLLILDTIADDDAILELCQRIRRETALASVPLLCIGRTDDVEQRIRLLQAGADDVIGQPYDGRELEAKVEVLVARFQRSRGTSPKPELADRPQFNRHTVAVFSPKGGVGTTTIATNIAAVMGSRQPDAVLLVDMDLQFGGVAIHLDLNPRQTIIDLAHDDDALTDAPLLRGYATHHESGVHVLAGTSSPEHSELLDERHLGQLLTTASRAYDVVIVDAGSNLDERTLLIMEWADSVVIPFHPEVPALKAVHSLLGYLNTTGQVVSKSILVLNNAFARQTIKMRDIELALGTPVAMELPYDALAYLTAANEGIPVVIGAPRSAAALRLTALAEMALGEAATEPAPAAGGARGGFLRRADGVKRGR